MSFARTTMKTGSTTPIGTPYQQAAQEWDNRIGNARVQARNWRFCAFGALSLAFLSTAGFIVKATESHYRVFIVPVDEAGKPGRIVLADDRYSVSTAEKSHFLKVWLDQMFSHPTDPVVLKNNITAAYGELTGAATKTIAAWGADNDPSKAPAGMARTVEIKSILPKTDNTYQVEWTEQTYDNGTPSSSAHYTGLFTLTTIPPQNQTELLDNPLGLRISSIVWTRS